MLKKIFVMVFLIKPGTCLQRLKIKIQALNVRSAVKKEVFPMGHFIRKLD